VGLDVRRKVSLGTSVKEADGRARQGCFASLLEQVDPRDVVEHTVHVRDKRLQVDHHVANIPAWKGLRALWRKDAEHVVQAAQYRLYSSAYAVPEVFTRLLHPKRGVQLR